MNVKDILNRLKDGNASFVCGERYCNETGLEKRASLDKRQEPYAVVVTCSDSRVVPEVLFNAGLGELFVIRIAGNVLGEMESASLEYAMHHLGCQVVVILGHTKCGAVAAAMQGDTDGLVGAITMPIRKVLGNEQNAYQACVLNVRHQVSVAKAHYEDKGICVVGAIYDIKTGSVEWL